MIRILNRLIKKHLSKLSADQGVKNFITDIEDVFKQQKEEKEFMERTLTLSFEELNQINASLKENLAENRENHRKLEKIVAKQNALFDASTEAVFSFSNDSVIEKMNQAGIEFLNISLDEYDENEVHTCDLFMARIANVDKFNHDIDEIRHNSDARIHGFFDTVDSKHYEYYSVPEVVDGDFIGRVWCCRDITNIRENEALLKHQANHDALTDLPNRVMILDALNHAISLSNRHDTLVGVLFIDLDDFKKINDTAGHHEGDRYLIEFAQRVKSALKNGDIIGRLGGDEFVVIVEGINDVLDIIQINERILALCEKPFYIKDKKYYMSCSVGVGISPDDAVDAEELIRKADMAMYQAKKSGKNTYHFFDDKLDKIALESVLLESQLREAINNDEFILHFQPKFELENGNVCGVEALIRWQKTPEQLIYPDDFIPAAEKNGLIRDITYWLVEKACKTMVSWQNTSMANIPISLNISALDFSDLNFTTQVINLIDQYQIDSSLLEFELTESIFFDDIIQVQQTIATLKSRKIKISIDDFGTGFSSFAYLRDIDIDYLKIDRSFVQNVHQDRKSHAIVKSIIDVGINLGVEVVAEGVESELEMNLLAAEGCHIGQGYFMSKPVNEKALCTFIEQRL